MRVRLIERGVQPPDDPYHPTFSYRNPYLALLSHSPYEHPKRDPAEIENIKNNDPSIERLKVDWGLRCMYEIDWNCAENKNSFGKNTHLKGLQIDGRDGVHNHQGGNSFKEFCDEVAANRSLEHIGLCGVDINAAIVTTLATLLQENSNLKSLEIDACIICDEIIQPLAAALSCKTSSLERLAVKYPRQEVYVGRARGHNSDASTSALISALDGHPCLAVLELGIQTGRESCIALGKLLGNPKNNVRDIDLEDDGLNNDCIDGEGAISLGNGLSKNATLKTLNMDGCSSIGAAGFQSIFVAMQSPNFAAEKISLARSRFNDGAAEALANVLSSTRTLKYLNLSGSKLTAAGWVTVFTRLQNSSSNLETLNLSYTEIDDEGINILSNALATNATLKKLDLGNTGLVSSEGWQRFSTFLRDNSVLETLDVGRSENVDDAVVWFFADALAQNNTLNALGILTSDADDDESDGEAGGETITKLGWMALTQVLCNKSDIESTYSCNHTLSYIDSYTEMIEDHTQFPDILSSLESNQNANKFEVARTKILRHHFLNNDDDMNVQVFIDMNLGVLQHVIAWLGRDALGLTVLHKLLQKMPSELCSRDKAKAGTRIFRIAKEKRNGAAVVAANPVVTAHDGAEENSAEENVGYKDRADTKEYAHITDVKASQTSAQENVNKVLSVIIWQCDVCMAASFDTYNNCVAHEKICMGKADDVRGKVRKRDDRNNKAVPYVSWQCDVCKEARFSKYEDCVAHEKGCNTVG